MGVDSSLRLRSELNTSRMEAIKKKMQAMKVEKDNACDRCDVCEEASKVAKIRAEKAEEKEKSLLAAEAEMNALNRRVQGLEEDLEKTEERANAGETKILELEEELRVVANILKSLEVAEEKANT